MKTKLPVRISFSKYLLEEGVKKKLCLAHFVAILSDGSTDSSITQQVVLCVIYTDPETFKPTMKFFEVVAPSDSQDARGLKQAIFAIFRKKMLKLVFNNIVFLVSDGASVNCRKDSRLIKLLQEDFHCISFIWCFTHRVKLTLKDA